MKKERHFLIWQNPIVNGLISLATEKNPNSRRKLNLQVCMQKNDNKLDSKFYGRHFNTITFKLKSTFNNYHGNGKLSKVNFLRY